MSSETPSANVVAQKSAAVNRPVVKKKEYEQKKDIDLNDFYDNL